MKAEELEKELKKKAKLYNPEDLEKKRKKLEETKKRVAAAKFTNYQKNTDVVPKKKATVHSDEQMLFYHHMKASFTKFMRHEVPKEEQYLRLNKTPNYNQFRGIWTHLDDVSRN